VDLRGSPCAAVVSSLQHPQQPEPQAAAQLLLPAPSQVQSEVPLLVTALVSETRQAAEQAVSEAVPAASEAESPTKVSVAADSVQCSEAAPVTPVAGGLSSSGWGWSNCQSGASSPRQLVKCASPRVGALQHAERRQQMTRVSATIDELLSAISDGRGRMTGRTAVLCVPPCVIRTHPCGDAAGSAACGPLRVAYRCSCAAVDVPLCWCFGLQHCIDILRLVLLLCR